MCLPLYITIKFHLTVLPNKVSLAGPGFIEIIYTAKYFGYIYYLLMDSSYGLSLFFIARKSVDSVLDPNKDLQIQDRILVDLKHLIKNTISSLPLLSGDPTVTGP